MGEEAAMHPAVPIAGSLNWSVDQTDAQCLEGDTRECPTQQRLVSLW